MTTRSRSKGVIQTQPVGSTAYFGNGTSAYYASGDTSCPKIGFTKVTVDTVTPNFHTLQKQGMIINNPFNTRYTERADQNGTHWSWSILGTCTGGATCTQTGNSLRYAPNEPSVINLPNVNIDNLKVLAGTQAAASVQEAELDVPVVLAEIGETFRMIHSPFRALERKFREELRSTKYRIYRTKMMQKKFGFARPARASDDLNDFSSPVYFRNPPRNAPTFERDTFMTWMGDRWLEARYGYLPVIRDLQAALGVLRDEPTHFPRYTARGQASSSKLTSVETVPYSLNDWLCAGTTTKSAERLVTVRAGVLYQQIVTMQSRLNWSPTAVPSAMWEGLPFSFVADWVLNVGDWLKAIQPKHGVHALASWTVVTDESTRSLVTRASAQPYPGHSTSGGVSYDAVLREMETFREPWLHVGLAFETNLLDLSQEKWRNRCLDVASFMAGFLGPRKR
nr:MAG: maturation protein [Leviviridae sp.]